MTFDFLTDHIWAEALRFAKPDAHIAEDKLEKIRRRIETRLLILWSDVRNKQHNVRGANFLQYSEHGSRFIDGYNQLKLLFNAIEVAVIEHDMGFEKTFSIPADFIENMEKIVKVMKHFHLQSKSIDREIELEVTGGKNSKPSKFSLHQSISVLYDTWFEFRADTKFSRKDFIDFCEICFRNCQAGVTSHSIAESLDRHVRPAHAARSAQAAAK